MNFWWQVVSVSILFLAICWVADSHFSTGRLGYRFHIWRKTRRFWFHRTFTCRWFGHRWGEIATGFLGACDRCFSEWPTWCDHCKMPVHGPEDWVSLGDEHRCDASGRHHTVSD